MQSFGTVIRARWLQVESPIAHLLLFERDLFGKPIVIAGDNGGVLQKLLSAISDVCRSGRDVSH